MLPSGTLVVNIQDYEGVPPKWAIMVILDNSQTMAGQTEPWSPNRMAAARDAIADLVNRVPQGSKIAIRDFFDEVSGGKKGRELRLRVSRVLLDWSDTRTKELGTSLNLISPGEGNNLCTAAVSCRILPGEKAELPPGSYSITLPEIPGLDPLKRTVQDVKIGAGDKTILDVRMHKGRPVVGVTRD